ncbi:GntR family transcriptional regulator [Prosthecobacter sp.]|uniref:GntR family transcriptional regulator n=1 Tax=Prosthecobacter sp. TaxID=1965333 RepID=UPI002487EAA6|nr:GntR family transcriptional regulator [Prosthecobacter sp.]MDI1314544.1 GntR family transcriptional regulator [Prosthecobacter sp.]
MTKNSFQPRRNLAHEIAVQLRRDIISGTFKPGEALAEPMLAERFGVSRAPVREAMIELERAGLVQFETTGRTRVRTLEEKDITEIVEARIALEAMGARLAAIRWTAEDTRWIEKSIMSQEKAATGVKFSQLDIAMHEYIMQCSGNERLVTLWQFVRWQFEMALTYIHSLQQKMAPDLRSFSVMGHRNVLKPLANRQPETAAKVMAQHIKDSIEWYTPEISEPPPTAKATRSGKRPIPAK